MTNRSGKIPEGVRPRVVGVNVVIDSEAEERARALELQRGYHEASREVRVAGHIQNMQQRNVPGVATTGSNQVAETPPRSRSLAEIQKEKKKKNGQLSPYNSADTEIDILNAGG